MTRDRRYSELDAGIAGETNLVGCTINRLTVMIHSLVAHGTCAVACVAEDCAIHTASIHRHGLHTC